MSSGGHNAKPADVLKLHGAYREDRHGGSIAAKSGGTCPALPTGLDDTSREMWDFVTTERLTWLARSDGPALQALCELWALRKRVAGMLNDDPSDKIARTAYIAYHAEWSKLAARFGLTPADRARLGEEAMSTDDLVDKYLG
jgi:phage terminase small subunit